MFMILWVGSWDLEGYEIWDAQDSCVILHVYFILLQIVHISHTIYAHLCPRILSFIPVIAIASMISVLSSKSNYMQMRLLCFASW